jgi:hypothetical protein
MVWQTMNERIRQLLSQVGVHYEVLPKDTVYEKFAELIVRECMDNLAWHGHDEAVSQLEWFKINKLEIK